jgi:hypothetical protein
MSAPPTNIFGFPIQKSLAILRPEAKVMGTFSGGDGGAITLVLVGLSWKAERHIGKTRILGTDSQLGISTKPQITVTATGLFTGTETDTYFDEIDNCEVSDKDLTFNIGAKDCTNEWLTDNPTFAGISLTFKSVVLQSYQIQIAAASPTVNESYVWQALDLIVGPRNAS